MSIKSIKQRIGIRPNYQTLIAIGQLSLAAGIILARFAPQLPWLNFIEGMLIGVSIVTNLAGLVLFGRQQREKGNHNG
jgi:hypothetical protein